MHFLMSVTFFLFQLNIFFDGLNVVFDRPSVFVACFVMEKVSNRSKNDSVEVSQRLVCAATPPKKVIPPQTDLEVKYFYTVDEKT